MAGLSLKEQRQNCWPNELEVLLLQAGLCAQPQAAAAWREFCGRIDDIEILDEGCYRLFPLVAANLQNSGEEFPHQPRILGVLRHAWAKNQRLFGAMTPLLRALQDAGVEMLLLKGAALAELYRRQGSVRSMADIDILIHPQDLARTIGILQARGCTIPSDMTPQRLADLLRFRHELTVNIPGGSELDIHWYLVSDARHLEAEDEFWRDAVPCTLAGMRSQTLHPTDQLLHTCLHGAQWNQISPVRWLADATMLIRAGVDWGRLEKQALLLERLEPVRDTLLFLDQLKIGLSPDVAAHWRKVEITYFEKVEGGYRASSPNSRDRTKQLAWIYLRLHRNQSLGQLLRGVPAYFGHVHHFRAYSRRITFLRYLLQFFYNRSASFPKFSSP